MADPLESMIREAEIYLSDLRSLQQRRAALFGVIGDSNGPESNEATLIRPPQKKASSKAGQTAPSNGKKMSLTAAVQEVLKAGPMTTSEIRSMIETRKLVDIKNLPAQLGMTLSKLKKDGKILQNEKRGPYSLAE